MSKPVSKSMIGAFVLGAIVLAVAAVMIIGSGKFMAKTQKYVMYFQGSVKGLNIGSPVMWNGVKIGSVTNISLVFDSSKLKFIIPVYAELDTSKITAIGPAKLTQYAYLGALIEKGLRAQLQTQSFVTGQLMVNVDFFPDQPAKFVGLDKSVPEVPTVPSTIEQLSKDIQNLPWKELFDNVHAAVEGINNLVNSPAAASAVKNMDQTLNQANIALKTINAEMGQILTNVEQATLLVSTSAAKIDEALSGEKGIPAQLGKTFDAAQKALAQANETLQNVQAMAGSNAWVATQAGDTLQEVDKTSRAIRALADYLERHPETLIRGKKAP